MSKNQNDMTPPAVENAQQSDTTPHDVAHQLAAVQSQIKTATDRRPPRYGDAPVTLVAVSKRQPDDKIDAALAAGQRVLAKTAYRRPASVGQAGAWHIAIYHCI